MFLNVMQFSDRLILTNVLVKFVILKNNLFNLTHLIMSRKFTLKYLLFLLFVAIAGTSNAQLVTIGTGTSISSNAPINSGANYSYTQQIYTPTEILAANGGAVPNGQIINVQFNLSASSFNSTISGSNTWTIYMGNTATATFPSAAATSWIPSTSMTQVFNGNVTFPAFGNWMTIPLTVPFTWDGVSNIVVAVNETNPGSDCCMYWTSSSTNPNYRTLYYYSYGSGIDVTAPPPASARTTATTTTIMDDFVIPLLLLLGPGLGIPDPPKRNRFPPGWGPVQARGRRDGSTIESDGYKKTRGWRSNQHGLSAD